MFQNHKEEEGKVEESVSEIVIGQKVEVKKGRGRADDTRLRLTKSYRKVSMGASNAVV